MTGDVEHFRAAVAAQEFSTILTHCTPVLVRVVLFPFRVRLAVSIPLRAAGAAPLRAMGKRSGLGPVGEISTAFGARVLCAAAGWRLVLALWLRFNVLSQSP